MFDVGPIELLFLLFGPVSGLLAAIYLAVSLRRNSQHH
jgi:hypothetical protein